MSPTQTIMKLYKMCVKNLHWSLRDLDETEFETLIQFLFCEEEKDNNTRVINGKTYKRAATAPSWL